MLLNGENTFWATLEFSTAVPLVATRHISEP